MAVTCIVVGFPDQCGIYSPPGTAYPFSVATVGTMVIDDLCDELKTALDEERIRRADATGVSYFVDAGDLIDNQEYNKLLIDLDTATYEGNLAVAPPPHPPSGPSYGSTTPFTHDEYSWGQEACSLYGGVSGSASGHEGWPESVHTDLTIKYEHLSEIRELINHLRTDCVCHTDCTYYSACDCHNNCGCNYSDVSLKDNFETIDGKDIVNNIDVTTWKYKEDTELDDKTHFGYIAQDVKNILESRGYGDQAIVVEENGILRIEKPYELTAILWDNVKTLNSEMKEVQKTLQEITKYIKGEK